MPAELQQRCLCLSHSPSSGVGKLPFGGAHSSPTSAALDEGKPVIAQVTVFIVREGLGYVSASWKQRDKLYQNYILDQVKGERNLSISLLVVDFFPWKVRQNHHCRYAEREQGDKYSRADNVEACASGGCSWGSRAPDQMLGSPARERWELVSAKRFLPRRADCGVVTGVPAGGSCKLVCEGFGVLQFSDIIIPK